MSASCDLPGTRGQPVPSARVRAPSLALAGAAAVRRLSLAISRAGNPGPLGREGTRPLRVAAGAPSGSVTEFHSDPDFLDFLTPIFHDPNFSIENRDER